MNKVTTLLCIYYYISVISTYDCSEYVSGISYYVDKSYYDFCHAIIGNQNLINKKLDIILKEFNLTEITINSIQVINFTDSSSVAFKLSTSTLILFPILIVSIYLNTFHL